MHEAWYLDALACPDCRRDLAIADGSIRCECGFTASAAGERLDLRPRHPQPRALRFDLRPASEHDLAAFPVDRPARDYDGPPAERDSSELFSAVRSRLTRGARLLDLGCGPRDQAAPAAHLGLQYVGIDFETAGADMLADAHAIPFRAETFDAVLAYAVLEHLYNPFVALTDVGRVLRRGGVFFGTVSQGEPYHVSYFHHTPLGVLAAFRATGFEIVRLWPSYDTLHALATMGRYARVVRGLIEIVDRADRAFPFLAPRRFFRGSARENDTERLFRAASICFVAVRH